VFDSIVFTSVSANRGAVAVEVEGDLLVDSRGRTDDQRLVAVAHRRVEHLRRALRQLIARLRHHVHVIHEEDDLPRRRLERGRVVRGVRAVRALRVLREVRERLRLAVLQQLEVLRAQPVDRVVVLVRDDHVDVVDADFDRLDERGLLRGQEKGKEEIEHGTPGVTLARPIEGRFINRRRAISSRAFFERKLEGGGFDRASIVSKIEARCFDRD